MLWLFSVIPSLAVTNADVRTARVEMISLRSPVCQQEKEYSVLETFQLIACI